MAGGATSDFAVSGIVDGLYSNHFTLVNGDTVSHFPETNEGREYLTVTRILCLGDAKNVSEAIDELRKAPPEAQVRISMVTGKMEAYWKSPETKDEHERRLKCVLAAKKLRLELDLREADEELESAQKKVKSAMEKKEKIVSELNKGE